MEADVLLSIMKSWIESEYLYQRNRKLEDNENEDFQKGYVQALANIDAVLRGIK